jgi:hypothetical protein
VSDPALYFIEDELQQRFYLLSLIALVAALIAGCLKGVMNNLRTE